MSFNHILLKLYYERQCVRLRRSFSKGCSSQGVAMISKVKSLAAASWPELEGRQLRLYYRDDEGDDCVLLPETWEDALIVSSAGKAGDGEDAQRPVLIKIKISVGEEGNRSTTTVEESPADQNVERMERELRRSIALENPRLMLVFRSRGSSSTVNASITIRIQPASAYSKGHQAHFQPSAVNIISGSKQGGTHIWPNALVLRSGASPTGPLPVDASGRSSAVLAPAKRLRQGYPLWGPKMASTPFGPAGAIQGSSPFAAGCTGKDGKRAFGSTEQQQQRSTFALPPPPTKSGVPAAATGVKECPESPTSDENLLVTDAMREHMEVHASESGGHV
ncbi:hypothetical protein FOL46_009544 [Perkinsus olseni]|uniref:PB1 domain-containing protein n=1 Tax=Perkinsus olseni TaxID=32597 RepID=A0A7J6KZC6_PEROL|nr:hypothetical protein FOL46_009544 [Perkinsus olseni]